MLCLLCNQRKGKRACPALGGQICAVCCGTKRLVEVQCPSDCGYLATSRAHPPAVVQRQQDVDRGILLPLLQGLSERQARLFLMLAAVVARHESDLLQKLVDEDIAQAAGALAATLETASRGIVYDHQPASLPAQRLMTELKTLVTEVSQNAGSSIERDAAIALRRIEHAAKTMMTAGTGNELQLLLGRVLAAPAASADAQEPGGAATSGRADSPSARPGAASSLIIP
jgi:hypothetical protein